ncbi:MAG: transcriptional regulator [Acidobacteria bacterium]|nr:MAG: transcriptional regulator [Acidobacteriota bacterium]
MTFTDLLKIIKTIKLGVEMFSLTCEYAIRALTYIATQNLEETTMVADIAKEANIPNAYLSKILMQLKERNILDSLKGPGGGFFFIKKPEDISLKDIVPIFDPDITDENNCIMGFSICGGNNPCPLHSSWAGFREKLFNIMETTTIAFMAEAVAAKKAFLQDPKEEEPFKARRRKLK